MTKKLNVDNLPLGVNDCDLEALFAPHGTVHSAYVITDPDTGGSEGHGLVEMATEDQSQAAIVALNGKDIEGNTLAVHEAGPREDSNVVILGAGQAKQSENEDVLHSPGVMRPAGNDLGKAV